MKRWVVGVGFLLALLFPSGKEASLFAQPRDGAPGRVTTLPERPRLGDLLIIYLEDATANALGGAVDVFGWTVGLDRVDDGRLRAIAPVPIDIEPGRYPIRIALEDRTVEGSVVVLDREFEEDTLRVASKFTKKPSPSLAARLAKEQREWSALFLPRSSAPRFFGTWRAPVALVKTAPFGVRRIFNGQTKSRHLGLDLEGSVGDPVHAVAAGRVVMSSMRFGSGGTIVIDHGSGLYTSYFHLSSRTKIKGSWVAAGERIGAVGKSGRVTGPHLHLSLLVRVEGKVKGRTVRRGLFVDPEPIFNLPFEGDPTYAESPPATRPSLR